MWVLEEINIKKKKSKLKYIIIIFLIIASIWGYYYFSQKKELKNDFKIAKVEQKTIYSTLSSDWKVAYKELYELNFSTPWTLKSISKKEWDKVKAWELIAKLDDRYAKINLDKAKIALENAYANLNSKLATKNITSDINISKEQLKSSETTLETNKKQWEIDVDNAEKNLESAKITLENTKETTSKDILNAEKTIESKQKDLEIAKDNLLTTTQTEELNVKNSIEKIVTQLDISLPILSNYFRDIDLIVWVTDQNRSLNDSFEVYLWAKNSYTKTLVESNFSKSFAKYNDFNSKFNNYKINPKLEEINIYTKDFISLWNDLSSLLKNTSEMLKSSMYSNSFPQSTIDSMLLNIESGINWLNIELQKITNLEQTIETTKVSRDTKILTSQNNIKSIELLLEQSKLSLEKIKSQSKSTIDDLEQKYKLASVNLSWAKVKFSNALTLANSQINISKANLDFKETKIDSRELEPYYVAIKNAKSWVDEAQKRLDDMSIFSPIDGNIWKLSITKIGTNIISNPGIPFAIILNTGSLYVESKVEEWDVSKIFLWQEVKLNFSSLENIELKWKVTYISDKADTDTNGITTYKTEISFNDKDYKWVKEWFTTQIFFILKKVENALILPVESIKTENSISNITINDWKDWLKKEIKIWVNDWDYVEILEGLKLWDEVRY